MSCPWSYRGQRGVSWLARCCRKGPPWLWRRGRRALRHLTPSGRVALRQDRMTSVFRDILGRDPGPEDVAQWNGPSLTVEQYRAMLRQSPEYDAIVKPLRAEIQSTYTKFLFRDPTAEEMARHVRCFREAFRTAAESSDALRQGNVRTHLGIRPLHLEIDLTTQCNLRCVMCYFSDERVSRRKRQDISVEDFSRIADQVFPLCDKVGLSYSTEPFLHRQFGELLAITKRYKPRYVYLTTNGAFLQNQLVEQLIERRLDGIAISIDAATRATHERIRVGSHFEKLLSNIRGLVEAKRRHKAVTPLIQLNFVLMKSNIRELPLAVRLAYELGANSVGAVHMVPYQLIGNQEESLEHDKDLCNRMLDEARALAEHYQIYVNLPASFAQAPDTSLASANNFFYGLTMAPNEAKMSCCRFPWHYVAIDPYKNVMPCGWWYNEPPMGNLQTECFEDIWNNERYRALRSEHLASALRATCQTCPAAGLGNVNNKDAFQLKNPLAGWDPARTAL